ncbi:unnamed protein product [Linum trigynum]|uniref:Reverse transcriptase n=1 Tax=Linum trigynum TaxID=586398 RepID=A0AAV2E0R5_9ROSI
MINQLTLDSGEIIEKPEEIADEAVSFYRKLYGVVNGEIQPDPALLTMLIEKNVSLDEGNALCAPVTVNEIKSALSSMKPDKAPGPDGWTLGFIRRLGAWLVKTSLQEFWNSLIKGLSQEV